MCNQLEEAAVHRVWVWVCILLLLFTYQFHLVGTESWGQNVPPLPPHIIKSSKEIIMGLSINTGSENASLTL